MRLWAGPLPARGRAGGVFDGDDFGDGFLAGEWAGEWVGEGAGEWAGEWVGEWAGTGDEETRGGGALLHTGVPSAAIAVPQPANAATTSTAPAHRSPRSAGFRGIVNSRPVDV